MSEERYDDELEDLESSDDAPGTQALTWTADESGERLDVFCARMGDQTRSCIRRQIESGDITINGQAGKASTRLKLGDVVEVTLREFEPFSPLPEDIALDIVYEDQSIAVINKPQGMVVHPGAGNLDGTLVNAILFHMDSLSSLGGELRPGIVHRLDRLTSGLIVIAKDDAAHSALAAQFKVHSAKRTYVALVDGNIQADSGGVDAPIGRHPKDRKRMAILPNGREAVTHWRVLERYGQHTLVMAQLESGRTHQIRVHMASLHHPVTGDTVYGASKPKFGLRGQALHGARLTFEHPKTGECMTFRAPLPDWFISALKKAGHTGTDHIEEWLDAKLMEN